MPYEDYQLARLWEDLLQCLPAVLDPVPDDLVQHTQDMEKWNSLRERLWAWASEKDDDEAWDLQDDALRWWSERSWDAGYLRCPPKIWLWTQGDTFHLRWDNRAVIRDGLPVWDATYGEITMPVTAFVEEVRYFHERLMAKMAERVTAVRAGQMRPDIEIDLDWLAQEQQDRSSWLTNALDRRPPEQNWDKVREAISTMERICYNSNR